MSWDEVKGKTRGARPMRRGLTQLLPVTHTQCSPQSQRLPNGKLDFIAQDLADL